MSEKESRRFPVIERLIQGDINGTEASKQCGLSIRHTKRLKARIRRDGAAGIIHKGRGKTSNRRVDAHIVKRMKNIITERYPDFGPTFTHEKLKEVHHITVGVETLRILMTGWGLWTPRPRKNNKEYRSWRERRARYGELQQFDGSYHGWFEDRAPSCCLLASIDDAQGTITKLQFTKHEGVFPAYRFWWEYTETHGKPLHIYLDRHSTYKQNKKKNILDNPEALTQFERAMEKLDIDVIHAYSPQAKGRIERLFGTLQDRLVKELRLRGISTIKEANRYANEDFIPRFNEKFSVRAQQPGDLHRRLTQQETEALPHIFARHHTRRVLNDFTVRFENQWLQLAETQPTLVCRKDTVHIEGWLDGSLHLYLRGKELAYAVLPERPERKEKAPVTALTRKQSPWRPPADHPWKRSYKTPRQMVETS